MAEPTPNPESASGVPLDARTARLLEKALLVSPEDWETRRHLVEHFLAAGDNARARTLWKEAPGVPDQEANVLLQARVEAQFDPVAATQTLERLLQHNRACAEAYWQLAILYRKGGQDAQAKRKYGAATLLDERYINTEWEAWVKDAAPGEPRAVPVQPGPPVEAAGEMGVSADEIAAAMRDLATPEPPARRTTFQEIGGMTDIIERIRMNIIYPFRNPQLFQKFNRSPGGGILLYGPPGCGKTHIARATAGECDAAFIPIAITDVLSKWLGESEKHLHEIFESARRRAPSVIFIDEIDAIGVTRADASASMAPIVNVLLTELDGIAADNRNVMVLAATNTPWRVDSALRRPGRFDRVIFVPPPDTAARAAILEIHLRDLPVDPVDLGAIARHTEKFSGADLRALVARAAEQAMLVEMKTKRPATISQKMLIEAAKAMRASTVEWLETARNYASYANRAGLYDDLAAYLEAR